LPTQNVIVAAVIHIAYNILVCRLCVSTKNNSCSMIRLRRVAVADKVYMHILLSVFWGRMHNTVVTTTSKLKLSYDDVVSKSVCITPS